jgi:uncharacterized protein (TIGR03492 family)
MIAISRRAKSGKTRSTTTQNLPILFCCFLAWGDLALAMAGTATEQFVGLGKPALVIPGAGPQFTRLFAERQCDLLGESVILVDDPKSVGLVVKDLLGDINKLTGMAGNGLLRMGEAEAAGGIAAKLVELWKL